MKLSEFRENIESQKSSGDGKLNSKIRELELILNLIKKINSSLILEDVLYSVLINAIKLTNSERGFIVLKNDTGHLKFKLGLDSDGNKLSDHFFNISTTVVEDVFLTGESKFIEGAQSDTDNHPSKSILRLALQTIFCSPLKAENQKIGVIYVDSKSLSNINLKETIYMFEILAGQAAIAIRNAKLYEELRIAKMEAEESDKLKTAFLSQMSHEIRTPLNTMLNYNTLLYDEFHDKIDEELNFVFSGMKNSGNRIIRTLDNVLNMSLLHSGDYEINPQAINVASLIEKLIRDFKGLAKSKGLDFNFINKVKHTIVIADDYTLTLLFQNLIDNAIKFTSEGFVEINITNNKSLNLVVEVIDSGKGISKNYLKNLFKIFSQEEIGYSRKFEGCGLGLALVKEFAKLNKCKLEVESKQSEGSKFTVVFDKKVE